MPALVVIRGPEAGRRVELDAEVVIGRGEVDMVIGDAELSRRHAVVRPVAGGIEVEDLGSLNGTWFEGRRLDRPTLIPAGGAIRVGETEIVVEVASAAGAADVALPAPARAPAPVEPASPARAPAPLRVGGRGRRRKVATRMVVPALITFVTIFATAAALIAYFATR